MADITISYKGATIAEVSASGTTTLETAGKYCEDDISLAYAKPSGGSYIGGTIAWNQMLNPIKESATGTYGGVTVTKNGDGIITLNGTATANASYGLYSGFPHVEAHKYFIGGYKKIGNNTGFIGYNGLRKDSGNGNVFSAPAALSTMNVRLDIKSGDVFDNVTMYPILIDLTLLFGSAIADYAYTLESNTVGAGVSWLKSYGFFTKPYYPYAAANLQSVELFVPPIKDSNGKIIGYFPQNFNFELRGILKLDSNNNLYYDGDEYDGNGTVTRKCGFRAYESGDATDGSTMITDGSNTVYLLSIPTTESV